MLKPKLPKPKPQPFPLPTLPIPSTIPKLQPPPPSHPENQILTLLKKCQSLRSLKQVHSQMLTTSILHPNHLLSKLIDLKDLPYSILLFSQIPHLNDFSYNIMIRALATSWKNYPLAFQFYLKMIKSGEKPNNFTYPFVLIASANIRSLYHGRTAHCSVLKTGLESDSHTRHSMITMYSKLGELGCARKVFDEISDRDLVSWNSMISGYSQMGFAREAVGLFRRMGVDGFEPNEMTLVSVLAACGDLGDLILGKELEGLVEMSRLEVNSFVGSALIDMYGKCGDLEEARRVFDGMPKRELVVWNAMITGQVYVILLKLSSPLSNFLPQNTFCL